MSLQLVFLPSAQIGQPLDPGGTKTPLAPAERQAVEDLFALAEPHISEGRLASEETLTALSKAYQRAKDLGLDRFCPVSQIGALFGLDNQAMTKAAFASCCHGCH